MRRWLLGTVLGIALTVLSFWGWHFLFPGPEEIVRKQLTSLARAASIPTNEGALTRLAHAQQITTFFTGDVEITVDIQGRSLQTITGRDELQQSALGARAMAAGLKVQFVDVSVVVASDRQSAVAHLTARADVPGEKFPQVQEMSVTFRKVERDWLISRAETVRTLH